MTNSKKKIIICWNKSRYADEIESQLKELGFDTKLHIDSSSLNNYDWKANYLIVLCELKWSYNSDNDYYSDFNGIKLVQYIRSKKNIKIPVLFVSFLSRKDILTPHPDAKIICTPALQNEFTRLPSTVATWADKLSKMKDLTQLELQYTQANFCDIEGLIGNMFHVISSRYTEEDLEEILELIQFAIDNKYSHLKSELLGYREQRQQKAITNKKDCLRNIYEKIRNPRTL